MRERWPATSINSVARCAVMRSAVPAPRAVYCRIMSAPGPSLARAVFLDLYGTVAREVGYINHPDRFRLHDFSGEAIRLLNDAGYRVFVATNQSGIARGYFTEDVLNEVHGRLVRRLAREGARVEAVYYCPHLPPVGGAAVCDCRKPLPGMLTRAAREHEVDLASSWMAGDMITDVETGHAAGARGILLRTGYGRGQIEYQQHRWRTQPDLICDDLLAAARAIIGGAPARDRMSWGMTGGGEEG